MQNLITVQQDKRDEYINQWLTGRTLPLIENDRVYFIYKNDKDVPVYLAGDMNAWQKDQIPFFKIIGSVYYYCEQEFKSDSRVEYKLIVDDKWILDPSNNRKSIGGYGQNSLLLMPGYIYSPDALLDRQSTYTIVDTASYYNKQMSIKYQSYYYRNILADSTSPLIIFNDGGDYLTYGAAGIILDNLIRAQKIPPCQALFLQPYNRMKEYWLNGKFIQVVFDAYLPWARKKYAIGASVPTYMGGASLGGLTAFYALTYVKLDGVFAQSGSFWVDGTKIITDLKNSTISHTKFYFDFATMENQDSVRSAMIKFLDSKNVIYKQNIWNEGHSWGNWRGHLSLALQYLLNKDAS